MDSNNVCHECGDLSFAKFRTTCDLCDVTDTNISDEEFKLLVLLRVLSRNTGNVTISHARIADLLKKIHKEYREDIQIPQGEGIRANPAQ